jgi:predicted HAD superfamily phosphohydrolase
MDQSSRRVFITDCEGPITKNDNAAELCEAFVPGGDRFFKKISLYDDYLAEVARRPGYKAGDTLRLILPFFKAFGLDNRSMGKFSRRNIEMIPQADSMLRDLLNLMPAYIVSTSYTPYIKAVCEAISFPYRNTYATEVDLDAHVLEEPEKKSLKDIHRRILDLPDFSIPASARSAGDLAEESRRVVFELDDIFWRQLPSMNIYVLIRETNPVGGREKARAIERIVEHEDVRLQDVLYVGDSITDVDAFRLVKSAGGLAVSFNGNEWAVKEASFAVTSRTGLPIGWIASLFAQKGLEGFEDFTMSPVQPDTAARLSELSCRVRKEVRTEKIGGLG